MLAVDNQQLNLTGDIVDEPHRIERGSLRVPNGAGLGVQLSQQKLEQYRAEQIGRPYLDVDRLDWFPAKPQY